MRPILLLIFILIFYLPSAFSQGQQFNTMTFQDSVDAGLRVRLPKFPGGTDRLLNYLIDNLKYPEDASKKQIEGVVLVKFIVSETGEISNVEVVNKLYPSCDEEAIRVVSSMPNWIPGEFKRKNVKTELKIPIRFTKIK